MRKSILYLIAFLLTSMGSLHAEPDPNNVTISLTPVAKNIYMLEGYGGNIGVSVGDDGILLVDSQFASLSEKMGEALQTIGSGKPRFVLNTHWHPDHTGGNKSLDSESTIIAHENVRKRLTRFQTIALFNMKSEPYPKNALPVITFQQDLTIYFNNNSIDIEHMPASHTDGDSIVFFEESNVIHLGDLFFAGTFPFVDVKAGGNVEMLAKSIGHILDKIKRSTKIIPGHGPLSSKKDLQAYHTMLNETIAIVKARKNKGLTLEQIQAEGFPEKYAVWGQGMISAKDWIGIIFESLS